METVCGEAVWASTAEKETAAEHRSVRDGGFRVYGGALMVVADGFAASRVSACRVSTLQTKGKHRSEPLLLLIRLLDLTAPTGVNTLTLHFHWSFTHETADHHPVAPTATKERSGAASPGVTRRRESNIPDFMQTHAQA